MGGSSRGAQPQRVEVRVELKPGVLDPEAEAVKKALGLLGVAGLDGVQVARTYTLEFGRVGSREARRRADLAVQRLLANPGIHRVEVRAAAAGRRR